MSEKKKDQKKWRNKILSFFLLALMQHIMGTTYLNPPRHQWGWVGFSPIGALAFCPMAIEFMAPSFSIDVAHYGKQTTLTLNWVPNDKRELQPYNPPIVRILPHLNFFDLVELYGTLMWIFW
jgi:hypothetical protein